MKEKENKQELSLEEAFARLDELVEKLEDRDVPLEESFQIYKEGMDLLKSCNEKIDKVEKKMQQINAEGTLEDF
ncbi:MAG: exodeoxyribonuclease VII small subunit [Eubacterium sp.]|nr:exodeoxyribonuclease VII small subunit [Eubacterium sp.]